MSSESPSTVYRAVDQLIEEGVVRKEGNGDKVLWSLTPVGTKLLNSMTNLVETPSDNVTKPKKGSRSLRYATYLAPTAVLVFALVRALLSSQPGWIAGGIILALAVFGLFRFISRL